MAEAHMLSIDLAKRSFQVCATDRAGSVLYDRTVTRPKLEALLKKQPRRIIAMEACATSHFWGRTAEAEGRTHQCFVGQRTQAINALRGHLAEFGLVFAQGAPHLRDIRAAMDDEAIDMPDGIRDVAHLYLEHIDALSAKIDPVPVAWPSLLRFWPNGRAYSNNTCASLTRRWCLEQGFVRGEGYTRCRSEACTASNNQD